MTDIKLPQAENEPWSTEHNDRLREIDTYVTRLRQALGRLSSAMGNPALQWTEDGSIEEALIDEAIRRLGK